jgi:hypothetical protein
MHRSTCSSQPIEELNKSAVLMQKTAVRREDLGAFYIVFVNYTEQEVLLPSGMELAYATRCWDPSRDSSPTPELSAANKKTAQMFERIQSENSAKVIAGVQMRLNEVTQSDSQNGWKGLRFDRENIEQVEELLKVLGLDAMEFGDEEAKETRRARVRPGAYVHCWSNSSTYSPPTTCARAYRTSSR